MTLSEDNMRTSSPGCLSAGCEGSMMHVIGVLCDKMKLSQEGGRSQRMEAVSQAEAQSFIEAYKGLQLYCDISFSTLPVGQAYALLVSSTKIGFQSDR